MLGGDMSWEHDDSEEVVGRTVEETIEGVVAGWEVFLGDEARLLEDIGELVEEVEDSDGLYWVKPRVYCPVDGCGDRAKNTQLL